MKKYLLSLIATLIAVTSLAASAAGYPFAGVPADAEYVPSPMTRGASFTDVSADNPYYDAIEYCARNNFMRGKGGGKFEPNGTFTRAEFITLWARTFHARMHMFNDATKAKNEIDNSILLMYGLGFIDGTSNKTFTHTPLISRESVAKLVENTYLQGIASNGEYKNYTDWAQVASWAQDAVSVCYQKGIFTGIAGTAFDPKKPITRGEACAVIMRLMKREPPPPATYTVTAGAAENGTVTPDKGTAAKGETVTLTVKPADGFALSAGSLKYNGTVIEGMTFTMPAENVVITALFGPATPPEPENPDTSPEA